MSSSSPAYPCYVQADHLIFSENVANEGGGAIAQGGTFRVEQSRFDRNEAEFFGGAVALRNGADTTLDHVDFRDNLTVAGCTPSCGGTIAVWSDATLDVSYGRFTGNVIDGTNGAGGAVLVWADGTAAFREVVIAGNTLTGGPIDGSALFAIAGGTLSVDRSIVTANTGAPAIASLGSTIRVNDSDVWGNPDGDWDGMTPPTGTGGVVSVDPLLLDLTAPDPADWDLHLATGSPLIGAGGADDPDADGTDTDLGLYGGAGGATWDLDDDGFPLWWHPGAYDSAADAAAGWDCADTEASLFPGGGC